MKGQRREGGGGERWRESENKGVRERDHVNSPIYDIIPHTRAINTRTLTSFPLSVLTTRDSARSHLLPRIILSTSEDAFYTNERQCLLQ